MIQISVMSQKSKKPLNKNHRKDIFCQLVVNNRIYGPCCARELPPVKHHSPSQNVHLAICVCPMTPFSFPILFPLVFPFLILDFRETFFLFTPNCCTIWNWLFLPIEISRMVEDLDEYPSVFSRSFTCHFTISSEKRRRPFCPRCCSSSSPPTV